MTRHAGFYTASPRVMRRHAGRDVAVAGSHSRSSQTPAHSAAPAPYNTQVLDTR